MNKKLIFRILGAISSALIIVSVFLPFINVLGYSISLWQSHQSAGTLYLPIMIIVFGLIGVIFFSLNIKTEFAYSTAGALLFFLIMQVAPIINQGVFNTLGMGFYCLSIGTIFTGIMAFLCNLKTKIKEIAKTTSYDNQNESVLSQIDRLYDNQNNSMPINMNENIQPIQSQEIVFNDSINNIEPVGIQPIPIQNDLSNNTVPVSNQQVLESIPAENIQPINQMGQMNNSVNLQQPLTMNSYMQDQPQVNPIMAEFNMQPQNNVGQTQGIESSSTVQPIASVEPAQTVAPVEPLNTIQTSQVQNVQNPVVSEFGDVTTNMGGSILSQPGPVAPTQSANTNTNTNNNLDIFG